MQAERGPGQPVRIGRPPGQLGRLEAGLPAAGQVAGPAAGAGELEQQLGPTVPVGRAVEDLEGPGQVAGGLLVGQAPGGLGGGQGGVADGRLRGPGPALGEVVGELGRRDRFAGVALLLEGAGHPQVEPGEGGLTEPGQDRLAEQVVDKAVRPQRPLRAVQDVGSDRLVEKVAHGRGRLAGDPRQQGGAELRPGDGGRGHQGGARRAQPGQAPLDHLAHPHRDPRRPAGLGSQQPGHLLDEERVAAGPPPDAADQRLLGLAAEDGGHQPGGLGLAERSKGQDGAPRDEAGEQGDERVALGLLEVAPGAEDQQAGGREPAGQEVQELERRGVRPLQVFQDDDQRPLLGGRQQHRGQLVEQPELGRRGQLVPGRRPVGCRWQLGQEPGQRGGAGREARRSPADGHERPEDLHPGPVGRRALPWPAPAPHHPRAATLRRGRRRRDHRRLADAGLAGEQDQPAPPAGQLLDGADELGEHVVPPDEPGVPGVVHSP